MDLMLASQIVDPAMPNIPHTNVDRWGVRVCCDARYIAFHLYNSTNAAEEHDFFDFVLSLPRLFSYSRFSIR